MSRKSRERRKAREEGRNPTPAETASAAAAVKRRRNRRLIFVALIGISFPILELIAYQFRAITVTVSNRSKQPVTKVKVTYPGGEFDAPELKPGGSITRVIRPDFSFQGSNFATYLLEVHLATANGIIRQRGRVGTIDFSAHETYIIEPAPLDPPIQIRHTTSPGFPLSLIRDLLERLGIG